MFCLDFNTDLPKLFQRADARAAGISNKPFASENKPDYNPGPELSFIPADNISPIKCLHKIPVQRKLGVSFSLNGRMEQVNPDDLDIIPVNCEGKVVYSLKISKGDPLLLGGYLQSEPLCPVTKEGRYFLSGDRIFCPVHGTGIRNENWYELRKIKETSDTIVFISLLILATPFFFMGISLFRKSSFPSALLAGLFVLFFLWTVPLIGVLSITGLYRAISENSLNILSLVSSLVFCMVAFIYGDFVTGVIPEIAIAVAVVTAVIFFFVSWFLEKNENSKNFTDNRYS
jgi:hypothetical protein